MMSMCRVSSMCSRLSRPMYIKFQSRQVCPVLLYNQSNLYPKVHPRLLHLSTTSRNEIDKNKNQAQNWPFRMTMTDEQKKAKEQRIMEMKEEEAPKSLIAKVKYYFKRYWYIAVPAHMVSCTSWFVTFYLLVHSGVDVISLLETLHIPQLLVEKIKDTPPSAGVFVIALLLYKIATPIRYATTLVLIQSAFWTLRRLGKLRTVREVEYRVRTEYEMNKKLYGRKVYRYRNMGVRDIERKNTQGNLAMRRHSGPPPGAPTSTPKSK